MKKISILILSLIFFWSGCADRANEVVVYTSVDQIFSEPILKDFERDTGIKVRAVFDTEETKSTGVLNRLLAERDNPRCDLFWSGDPGRSVVLQKEGITRPYVSPAAEDIPAVFKDRNAHWTGFSARARILLYNEKLMNDKEVPRSIFDLTEARYRGKVAIANPLFGTTTYHLAALFTAVGDEKAEKFMSGLKENGVIIASSNGDVKNRVLREEVACGLTDTDDAFEAMKESDDVGIVFLDQEGIGSLIMPNTVSLIKNSPHPGNGEKLADYLLSRETEAKLAASCAQMPLHKGVKTPAGVPSLDNIVPMRIDYQKTADKLVEIRDFLQSWVED